MLWAYNDVNNLPVIQCYHYIYETYKRHRFYVKIFLAIFQFYGEVILVLHIRTWTRLCICEWFGEKWYYGYVQLKFHPHDLLTKGNPSVTMNASLVYGIIHFHRCLHQGHTNMYVFVVLRQVYSFQDSDLIQSWLSVTICAINAFLSCSALLHIILDL